MTAPVVGIDFSTKALHVALLDGPSLLSAKRYGLGETKEHGIGVITKLAMALQEEHGGLQVYTERPFMLRGERMNPQTTIELSLLVGAIRGLFVAAGHAVTLVKPDEWRSVVGVTGKDRAIKKASAIRIVRREFGIDLRNDDNMADAVCIACYGRQVQRRNDQLAKAGAR